MNKEKNLMVIFKELSDLTEQLRKAHEKIEELQEALVELIDLGIIRRVIEEVDLSDFHKEEKLKAEETLKILNKLEKKKKNRKVFK